MGPYFLVFESKPACARSRWHFRAGKLTTFVLRLKKKYPSDPPDRFALNFGSRETQAIVYISEFGTRSASRRRSTPRQEVAAFGPAPEMLAPDRATLSGYISRR